MQIHIGRDGQKFGPYSLEEVNNHLAAGTLRPTDLAWYEGASGWAPVAGLPGVILPGAQPAMGAVPPLSPPIYAGAPAAGSSSLVTASSYGGFWVRVLAYIIDGIIVGIVAFVIKMLLGLVGTDFLDHANTTGNLLNFALGFLYMTVLWSSQGATLGQKALGLAVTTLDGQRLSYGRAVARYFALLLSFVILLIGVLMVAFTERKQGLHDLLAGTYVVKVR